MSEADELLTVDEFAAKVRRTRKTIYQWIREGKVFQTGEVKFVVDGYLITAAAMKRILKDADVIFGTEPEKPEPKPPRRRVISEGIR